MMITQYSHDTDRKKVEVRASLIDRLTDDEPFVSREKRPLRTISLKKLRASVARDMLWLLNTRTPVPESVYRQKELTVTEYGIPDFSAYSPANPDDREMAAASIGKAVSAFEPRLRDVRVSVKPGMRDEKSLSVIIEAMIVIDDVREPISFQTIFQKDIGVWEIDDSQP